MSETRAGRYGRNLAILVNYVIGSLPECQRKNYREAFLKEIGRYSFAPRKAGQPRNSGCVHELANISSIDVGNPCDLAKLVKEGIHLMYQKQTSFKVMNSLVSCLKADSQSL